MAPPKKDNVIDIIKRLQEKGKTERPIIKELMAADFNKFKEIVAYAIDDLYEKMTIIQELSMKMAEFHLKSAIQANYLQDIALHHSHEEELVKIPEWVREISVEEWSRETPVENSDQDE